MADEQVRIDAGGKRAIGLWSAIAIGIGGMVGAGIFSILGVATQISGNAIYVSFMIAGAVALLCTYSYAKLGAVFPSAGGPVEFLIRGFGDGIMSGGINILLWVGYVFALSLYARAFGSYAATFLPAHAPGIWVNLFATAIVLAFTGVSFLGPGAVGKSETAIVAIKVLILVAFVSIGSFFIKSSLLSVSHWPQAQSVVFGAALVFLAYEGFGLITNAAGDMENPRATLPKALYLSVIIVIVIYVAVSVTVVGNLAIPAIAQAKDYALAQAAQPFLGVLGFKIIAIAALFSTMSAINATLYGGANVSYIVAKEGQLPRIFDRKVWRQGREGLIVTSGLVLVAANLMNLGGIAMLGSAAFLIIYGAVNIGHLRLRKQTKASGWLILASVAGCFLTLIALIYYEIKNAPATLAVLVAVVGCSFLGEWVYRRLTSRKLRSSSTEPPAGLV
jgi:amino acid transporter